MRVSTCACVCVCMFVSLSLSLHIYIYAYVAVFRRNSDACVVFSHAPSCSYCADALTCVDARPCMGARDLSGHPIVFSSVPEFHSLTASCCTRIA